jgi:hypothetical protein
VADAAIRLFLADVDGTLVTNDKVLTDDAVAAVRALGEHGVRFAITSGRPPRGMGMLIEPLALTTPIAAFNGGLMVDHDMKVIEERVIAPDLVKPAIEIIEDAGLVAWLYRGTEWYVQDPNGPHVDREAATVQFPPTVVKSYDDLHDGVAKIVGVSDDKKAMDHATDVAHERLGDRVSAAQSQPYYLDITHPDANKGSVVEFLSRHFTIPPEQIATIGDMPNDVLMFTRSGLAIAMGNAAKDVQQAAHEVTASNEDDGFAKAVQQFVLPRA